MSAKRVPMVLPAQREESYALNDTSQPNAAAEVQAAPARGLRMKKRETMAGNNWLT